MLSLVVVVNVVIIIGLEGYVGFMVIVVCSVSDNFVMLLVCLNCGVFVYQVFKNSMYLVINIFILQYQLILNIFGGKVVMNECFEIGDWVELMIGCLRFVDVVVSFDCIIIDVKSVVIYDVIFCQVVDIK